MPGHQTSAVLGEMMQAVMRLQAFHVAARLRLADEIGDGARTPEELAGAVGADAGALRRLMRYLTLEGVLEDGAAGRFSLAPLGRALREDAPDGLRSWVLRMATKGWPAWGELLHSVQTGQPAYDRVFGRSYFDDLEADPEERSLIAEMLATTAASAAGAVLEALDLGACRTVVDVGGGEGRLLASLLAAHPHLSGVLFDAPGMAALAQQSLAAAGLADRCRVEAGDFFASVPPGGDLYLLSWVLHDWDDERAGRILRNCRAAMSRRSRLLVLETLMGERPRDTPRLVLMDLGMLVNTGGRERTAREYRELLATAGLKLERIVDTGSQRGASLLEAAIDGDSPAATEQR